MNRKFSSSSIDSSIQKNVLSPTDASLPSSVATEKPLDDVEQPNKDVVGLKLKYPRSVFFIIVNEFCERFNYYGMRTILTLYMKQILNFSEDLATILYHTFLMLYYFTPIPGAMLADTYLGKFKTIVIHSILYAFGSIMLSVSAIPMEPQVALSMTALFIIAIGTGGIKACVSAFGGDQFVRPQQEKQLVAFFSVFYFSVNTGSLISTFVTPILREDVHCFNKDSCYPLAFGVPAILMIVAVVIFIVGKPMYKIKKPEGNIMGEFFKCIGHAIKRKLKSKGEKHDHWLDFASDKFEKQLIEDVKRVLSVSFVFIPLPVFWALYDQQGSRWTFQATRMNGDLGGFVLKPDQMQIVNPLLILLLVPLFEAVIYPAFKKCGLLTFLQRIGCGLVLCGLVLCGLSFVVSGFVELALEPTYAVIPGDGLIQLNFINTLPCEVKVAYSVGKNNNTDPFITIGAQSYYFVQDLEANQTIYARAYLEDGDCAGFIQFEDFNTDTVELGTGYETFGYSTLITSRDNKLIITRINKEEQLEKSESGDPLVAFFLDDKTFEDGNDGNITLIPVKRKKKDPSKYIYYFNTTAGTTPQVHNIVQTDYTTTEIGDYIVTLNDDPIGQLENLMQGGVYRFIIQNTINGTGNYIITKVEVTRPNSVGILWLLPQYFVVTVGEVMFSVTGLSFSYSQAPVSMKSVMTAIWLMTTSVGNLIDIIVIQFESGSSQAEEFFLFAGIMGIAFIIFTLMSFGYKYVDEEGEKKEKKIDEQTSSSLSSSDGNDDVESSEAGEKSTSVLE